MSPFARPISRVPRAVAAALIAAGFTWVAPPAGAQEGASEAAELVCPRGTERMGKRPPHGPKEWCALPGGTQHGPSVSYYETGAQMARATFDEGKLDGLYEAWHPNGQLAESGRYENDKREGTFRTWDPDGRPLNEATYEHGELHGPSRIWFPNGQLMVEVIYANGKRNGSAVTYYQNGQKRTEGVFRNDAYHGVWRGWYADGSPEKVAEFDEGKELSRETFPPPSGGGS